MPASAEPPDTREGATTVDPELLGELEAVAQEAAGKAGAYVRSRFGGELKVDRKGDSRGSLVTDADFESQKLIGEIIASRFPDHLVLGEEDPPDEAPSVPDFVWAVDPIDGTTNFVNGLPIYAVSVAALHLGRPVAGACYVPWPAEDGYALLHARSGGGAWSGEERLSVRGPADGAAPEKGRVSLVPAWVSGAYRVGKELRGGFGEPRVTGSVVYELGLVATGVSQYSLTGFASVWDFAAGTLLTSEAGGTVMTLRSRPDGRAGSDWVPLESFADPYDNSPETYKRLRSWHGPVLVGEPGVVEFLARNLRLRRRSMLRRVRSALFRRRS